MVDCTNILSLLKINSESLKCDPEIVTSDEGYITFFTYKYTIALMEVNLFSYYPLKGALMSA